MGLRNKLYNADNPAQNIQEYKRVLCLCSAGLLRSPSAAVVLAGEPFNCNTRAAGLTSSYALIDVSEQLLAWADEIVVMNTRMKKAVEFLFEQSANTTDSDTPIITLDIPDTYQYRAPELMQMISDQYMCAMTALYPADEAVNV